MLSPPKDCDLRTRRSSHPFAEARLDGRARRARSRLRDALPGTAQAGARRAPLARPRRPSRHDRARSRKFFAAGGGSQALALEDRRHFFTHAAKVMPSIIVDFAREQLAQRRGGSANVLQLTASGVDELGAGDDEVLMRVNDALLALEAVDPALSQLVEMRFFAGYTEDEMAELLDLSGRTIRRQWEKARAFLVATIQE